MSSLFFCTPRRSPHFPPAFEKFRLTTNVKTIILLTATTFILQQNMSTEAEQEISEEEAINAIYEFAANLHVEQKLSKNEVIQKLVEEGLDYESSVIVVDNIRASCRKELRKALFFSLLWLIGGIAVTVISYNAAKDGGTYYVTWGAILYGLVTTITNFCRMTRYMD